MKGDLARADLAVRRRWLLIAFIASVILGACDRGRLPSVGVPPSNPGVTPTTTTVLVVDGIFDPSGQELLQLGPVRLQSWPSQQISPAQRGEFIVEVRYTTGQTSVVPFDAIVADDSAQGITQHGFFEVALPVMGPIASVLIMNTDRTKTFGRIDGSDIGAP